MQGLSYCLIHMPCLAHRRAHTKARTQDASRVVLLNCTDTVTSDHCQAAEGACCTYIDPFADGWQQTSKCLQLLRSIYGFQKASPRCFLPLLFLSSKPHALPAHDKECILRSKSMGGNHGARMRTHAPNICSAHGGNQTSHFTYLSQGSA